MNTNASPIQWYPGHMAKARRMMQENLGMVDVLCEILDARIPHASRNPDIDVLAAGKPRVIVLGRADLTEPKRTDEWKQWYEGQGYAVLACDSRSPRGIAGFSPMVRELLEEKISEWNRKGQSGRKIRLMAVGIPNVGKSTFINSLAGRKAAIAGDRPGVTRGKQWISVDNGMELLDTPGILWPKFEDPEVGELLAVTNAIKAEILDREALASTLMQRLCRLYPEAVVSRYKIEADADKPGYELLEEAARKRGFLVSGGETDTERMANTLLNEYHSGKLGRLTLEEAPKG